MVLSIAFPLFLTITLNGGPRGISGQGISEPCLDRYFTEHLMR
jgi:hypothetical protein